MSREVWKYPLVFGPQTVTAPENSDALHVATQDGQLCLWALVDPAQPPLSRDFIVVGTGNQLPDNVDHIGTALDGPFVWHVFQVRS